MNFVTKDNWPSVLFAMAGGVVLSIGNLSTQYALAYVGLSLTEVIFFLDQQGPPPSSIR
jgi:hypothetical protein